MNIPRVRFGFGTLDGNHHDWSDGKKGVTVHGPAWKFVALGREGWHPIDGRKLFGLRLLLYAPSGANANFDVYLIFKRCPCRPPSRYAPRPQ